MTSAAALPNSAYSPDISIWPGVVQYWSAG
jgi:hypothetical protein